MRKVLDTGGTGVDGEIAIEVPGNFDRHTPAERHAWAAAEIDALAGRILADLGSMPGVVPTPKERETALRAIRRCVDGVLGGPGYEQ